MKIILIILFCVLSVFIIIFLIGFVLAAATNRKREYAHSILLLSQITEDTLNKLINILLAYRNKDSDEINRIICGIGKDELNCLISMLGPDNRPKDLSSGKFMDYVSWTAMENSLQEQGYTINSSKIITGIVLHGLDTMLLKLHSVVLGSNLYS